MKKEWRKIWTHSYKHRTLSLVYNADAFYKTPDEEIAAEVKNRLARISEFGVNPSLVSRVIASGMRRCAKRHVVDSCPMCVKLGFCRLHELDIDITLNGVQSLFPSKFEKLAGKGNRKK